MKKDSMKGLAIVFALVVIVFLVVLFLLKGCSKQFTVTFDSNGGSPVSAIKVKENEMVNKPNDPTREGYTFVGWYLNDVKYDFSSKVTEDITLKAEWNANPKDDIALDVTTLSLTEGSSRKINVTLSDGLKDAELVWKSSDESIATVDSKGNIKALKEGEVTITVATEDGKYSKDITVTVRPATDITVTKVVIKGEKEVEVGKTIKLTATISPKNAANKNITWKSSNTNVAIVDENGNVKGIKAGTAKITVTTEDGGKTATITITVKDVPKKDEPSKEEPKEEPVVKPEDKTVAVKGVSIKNLTGKTKIYVGESVDLQAILNPGDATNKNVTWTIDKKDLGSIATDGLNATFIAKAKGTVTVTVKTADGSKTATIKIEVLEKATPVKKYTVTFQSEGKTDSTVEVEEGKTVSSYTPSREGYEFVEWRLNGKKYDFNTKVTGDITLVAEWKAIYIVEVRAIVQEGTGAVMQYEIVEVKKGNEKFTDYETIYFAGHKVSKGNKPRAEYIEDGATAMINNSIKATIKVVK